ncbi:MAG TPA: hypothetical protein PKJ15_05130 [Methanomassiliicoccales archaeon]|nr:hypothetical protein [Methanomassiliicoccales archaeon]
MLEPTWKKEAEKDKLNDAERASQLVSWIFTAIAAWFLLAVWTVSFPALFIILTILLFNILGDSLRDVLDPKLKL